MKIKLKNLTKKFPKRNRNDKEVIAVNNFNLDIPEGKLISLLGPSGCGKSTALNLICGLEKPTSGEIFFDDEDVTNLDPQYRGVGMVFQSYALYPHLTVKKNILFPLQNLKGDEKLSKEEMEKRVMEAAKLVQIEELLDRKPGQLSGGQQQRVAIARALVKMPKVLLLDEPLSNLDARLRLKTREEIRRIQKETHITTIFVTHDQEEAMSISDVMIVMKDGIIQQVGKAQEIYDNPVNLFVAKFLGTPQINIFDAKIKNGKLFIGDFEIMDIIAKNGDKISDMDIWAGIRPEGFVYNESGNFHCNLKTVEVMGRDTSVVADMDAFKGDVFRAIIPGDTIIPEDADEIRFNIKKNKLYIFDKNTEERIEFN